MASQFLRGWETFAHFVAMLRASLARHFALSLLAGLVFGSLWFLSTVEFRSDELLGFLLAEVKASLRPRSGSTVLSYVEAFDGRPLSFLGKQWLVRVLLVSFVSFLVGALLVARHGRTVLADRARRGVRLRDLGAEHRARVMFRALVAVGVGAFLPALVAAVELGIERLALLSDYLVATLSLSSEVAAAWLSPDGSSLVFIDRALKAGFYVPAEVHAHLLDRFDSPLSVLAVRCLTKAVVLGGAMGVAAVWLNARQRGTENTESFSLAGVPIPPGKECYHVLACGSPGSGKSTAIKDLLDQIRARGQRAIVYDVSGEYLELYFREGKDKLLNPLDQRSERWTLWAEIEEPADYDAIAKSLFPKGGSEPFWAEASAVLFASAAAALAKEGARKNVGLYKSLTSGAISDLRDLLKDTPASRLLDPDAGAMPANLIATVTSQLQGFSLLPDPKEGEMAFSIRQFLRSESAGDGWLFLSTGEAHAQVLKPLLSLWADLAVSVVLSLPPADHARVWCVLDEVASLQRLPALPALLERGRKHGAAVVLGLQAMPQLQDAYGRELAAALLAQPQTWLVLRSVEPDTAKWLERALGQAEVDEAQESHSMGAEASRDGVSLHRRTVERPVALAAEITSLPDLHGYLRLPGDQDVFRVAYRPKTRKRIAEAFVPRVRDGPKR